MIFKTLKIILALILFTIFTGIIVTIRGDNVPLRGVLSKTFLSSLITGRDKIAAKAKLTTLNHFIPPSFDALVEFTLDTKNAGLNTLTGYNGYIDYYREVIKYFPRNADAYALLGFCYFHLGDYEKSLDLYKKSLLLNPDFFWSHYNLGVIYLKIQSYAEAAISFKLGMNTDPQKTLETLYTSKIYQQIRRTKKAPQALDAELKQGYQECLQLLTLSLQYTKRNKSPIKRLINVRIF